MSDNRKYYYLKLKENYFDEDAIAVSYTHLDVYKRQAGIRTGTGSGSQASGVI